MPFPLAHVAPVLPLRRFCPKRLDFPALVIGSLSPDLAACIDDLEYFSHSLLGSFFFCLPFGLITIWAFYRFRQNIVSSFPNPHRQVLTPLCRPTQVTALTVISSLLIGSWLHILWDLFTHDHSWLVHWAPLLSVSIYGIAVNHGIWLISTLGGSAVVIAAYALSVHKAGRESVELTPQELRLYALWLLILMVPFALSIPLALHNASSYHSIFSLLRVISMYYLGLIYATLMLAGFVFGHFRPKVG